MPNDLHKAVEQFVLAHNGGVLLPVSVPRVCQMILEWHQEQDGDYVPGERKCPSCNYRKSGDASTTCPVDGSRMVGVTWREASLTASRIASRARKRCEILEAAFPEGHAIPIGEEADDLSIEEKIERLQEKGLYNIAFRNAGVGLMFFEPPDDGTIGWEELVGEDDPNYRDMWRQYLAVERYYPTLDEAVNAEFLKRL